MNSKTNHLEIGRCKIQLICELLRWDCISSSGKAEERICVCDPGPFEIQTDFAHEIVPACFLTGVFCMQLLIFFCAFTVFPYTWHGGQHHNKEKHPHMYQNLELTLPLLELFRH